jgi:pantothenate kinase type III
MKVKLSAPSKVIEKNAEGSIRSGIILGYAGLVDHLLKLINAEMSGKPQVISTWVRLTLFHHTAAPSNRMILI